MTRMKVFSGFVVLALLVGFAPSVYAHPSGDPAVARVLWHEALRYHANWKVKLALFEAAVTESGMRNLNYGDRDSLGVLQIRWRLHGWRVATHVNLSADWFLNQAVRISGRYRTAGQLAQAVEVSAFPYRYDQHYGWAMSWIRFVRGF